jgi:uncharacterized membrane protein
VETMGQSWVLKRNCALTPKQLSRAFIALGLTTFVVSAAWALSGAWVVLAFMLIEWIALAAAFFVYARHASDHERVTLESDKVCIEVVRGDRLDRHELPRSWLRCQLPEGRSELVRIQSQQQEFEVGQFVNQTGRQRFYQEFKAAIGLKTA